MKAPGHYRSGLTIGLGIAFWTALLSWVLLASQGGEHSTGPDAISSKVTNYLFDSQKRFRLRTDDAFVSANDPVFFRTETGDWKQIGHIVGTESDGVSATVSWYGDREPRQYRFRYHRNKGTLEDALATLFPPSKRAIIHDKIADATQAYREELSKAFEPVVLSLFEESIPVIVNGVSQALQTHRDAFAKIAARYKTQILENRLMPLAESEVLPSIRQHGGPVAKKIGYELWERASLWRFGWRMAHDKLPLTGRDLVKEEWARFVREEAVPVFEKHTDTLLQMVQRVGQDVASNDRVRREIGEAVREMLQDDEFKRLMGRIFSEAVVENDRLHKVWLQNWHSRQMQAALELTSKRLEPLIREIADEILGSRESGITPEFARVLRNQVLGKDRRWIVARPRETPLPKRSSPVLHKAERFGAYPLVHLTSRSGSDVLEVLR